MVARRNPSRLIPAIACCNPSCHCSSPWLLTTTHLVAAHPRSCLRQLISLQLVPATHLIAATARDNPSRRHGCSLP
ncbi:hypothetical protein NL676_030748 [Syzygium grande]|nr:hypothetical protein NL676_030748 [Syzygium grande]